MPNMPMHISSKTSKVIGKQFCEFNRFQSRLECLEHCCCVATPVTTETL